MQRRILVVEDDADLQFILQVTLESAGYEVASVRTAEDAEPLIADADLVMLDVRLPGMSGMDLLERLIDQVTPPIVIMSAHADRRVAEEAVRLGATAFLRKPFLPRQLTDSVAEWLEAA